MAVRYLRGMVAEAPDAFSWLKPDFSFDAACEQAWAWQYQSNPVIREFCERIGTQEKTFIPISFFKHFELQCGNWSPQEIFTSSGTTGQTPSRHLVKDLSLYRENMLQSFRMFYSDKPYSIFALLPGYLERKGSSLIWMVQELIRVQGNPGSGFYLGNFSELKSGLIRAAGHGEKILLLGVSFALLDFAEAHPMELPPDTVVMETGGMKGRREEITRGELHGILKKGLGVKEIYSEYGMTELLSQAYARAGGLFRCPPWMKITVEDIRIPGLPAPAGVAGRVCITDLMNIHTCCFIRTDDLGIMHPDNSFEILGRLDEAELRGCNLMAD